jgi:hypothetical protein
MPASLLRPARAACAGLALASLAVVAQAAASSASVEKLLTVMKVEKQLDLMYTQTLPTMQAGMRNALAQQLGNAEADKAAQTIAPKVNAVIRDELSWSKLKPEFVQVYAETFSQAEIDAMIQFYSTPTGAGLVDKMPQVAQRSALMMQKRMGPVMQRVMQVVKDEAAKQPKK